MLACMPQTTNSRTDLEIVFKLTNLCAVMGGRTGFVDQGDFKIRDKMQVTVDPGTQAGLRGDVGDDAFLPNVSTALYTTTAAHT